MLTASYSVNEEPIEYQDLKNIVITRKDYIDYVENLLRKARDLQKFPHGTNVSNIGWGWNNNICMLK